MSGPLRFVLFIGVSLVVVIGAHVLAIASLFGAELTGIPILSDYQTSTLQDVLLLLFFAIPQGLWFALMATVALAVRHRRVACLRSCVWPLWLWGGGLGFFAGLLALLVVQPIPAEPHPWRGWVFWPLFLAVLAFGTGWALLRATRSRLVTYAPTAAAVSPAPLLLVGLPVVWAFPIWWIVFAAAVGWWALLGAAQGDRSPVESAASTSAR
jgi:hypothetical protein